MNDEDLIRLSHEVNRFIHAGNLGHGVVPTLYFEFADMHQMRHTEMTIRQALAPHLVYIADPGKAIKALDRDSVEISIGGLRIVLRCISRYAAAHGTDAGYTEVKWLTSRSNLL